MAVLLVAIWFVAQLGTSGRMHLAEAVRSTALVPFLSVHSAIAARRDLKRKVTTLRAERDSISRDLLSLRSMAGENRALRALASLSAADAVRFQAVEIVPGEATFGEPVSFLLRAGRAEGIHALVGVATAHGLLGVIRSVGEHAALGEFWTHPEFRVSVRTEGGAETGIIRADRGRGGQSAMRLEGAPFQAEISPGTRLVTSGAGGIYLPGILVGTVRETYGIESGWERSYRVAPAVRPETARIVLVARRGSTPEPASADSASNAPR